MADSIQEMSFQNVVDTILKPQGIKVGGYPDDLFIDLAEKDRERFQCNICYLVLRDPRQCDNQHKFCNTCVFAWSMTYGANSDKCPVCRSKQHEYAKDPKLTSEISLKWVKCPETGCALRCSLGDFLQHSHGTKLFGNSDTSAMDNVRQTRRPPPVGSLSGAAELVFLPTLGGGTGGAGGVREGRNLLQDMLLVLHLEMELRRRAIDRFSSTAAGGNVAAHQIERDRHVTEVLAIQEQMQEISGFLNILFSIPPQRSTRLGGMNSFPGPTTHDDTSSDGEDSDSSLSTVGVDSQYRLTERNRARQLSNPVVAGNRNTSGPAANSVSMSVIPRPLSRTVRRSEVRQGLTNNTAVPSTPASTTRAATNRIDVNSNPMSSTSTRPRSSATQVANSVRRVANDGERDQAVNIQDAVSANEDVNASSTMTLPRASTTFRSALEQLPPISTASNAPADSERPTGASTRPISNVQPGTTPAPHRRPVPPVGQGRSINTTRARRQLSSSNNQNATSSENNSTSPAIGRPASRTANNNTGTSQRGSNIGQSSQRATNPSQSNNTNSSRRQTNQGTVNGGAQSNRSGLPATSGALLRARRRSEIQQQINQDLSTEDDDNS